MDKMKLFCTHIRAALACYEDMPPEGQARARLFVIRKSKCRKGNQQAFGC